MQKFEIMESGAAPAGNRILIVLVAVCAIVAVVAIVIAAMAVSKSSTTPNITIQGDQTTIGGGTSAGQGSSAGSSGGNSGSAVSSSSGGRIFTIAIGHDGGPHEYIDTTGYLAGFNFDLIDAVCTEAGMDCRTVWDKYVNCWDSTPGQPSHGGQGLMGRWYDACTGWFPTIGRVQVFSFSSPFLKPPVSYFFTKTGNAASFSSRNVANKKIGFIDGWASDEKCLARWTDVKGRDNMTVVHAPTPRDIVAKLKSGEVLTVGTKVLKRNLRRSDRKGGKQENPWLGPYVVKGISKSGSYILQIEGGCTLKGAVNRANLKVYVADE
ncbi:uncharacterized protein LOC106181409 [Lingula anatina]|uniref:Uncharacterized protein LOC106181409 n=1 Tax=Lingula anatina TaxID=7574 RepID=A0A1S3KFN3_LINAN|nr:uncharacterized protein LOC106181409 [Lingula anatina]|eukprot:XP_013421269.1 uncharacterized protein LOC106181409 [Lingula anatina]